MSRAPRRSRRGAFVLLFLALAASPAAAGEALSPWPDWGADAQRVHDAVRTDDTETLERLLAAGLPRAGVDVALLATRALEAREAGDPAAASLAAAARAQAAGYARLLPAHRGLVTMCERQLALDAAQAAQEVALCTLYGQVRQAAVEGRLKDLVEVLEARPIRAQDAPWSLWAAESLRLAGTGAARLRRAGVARELLTAAWERLVHLDWAWGQVRAAAELGDLAVQAGDVAATESWRRRTIAATTALHDRTEEGKARRVLAAVLSGRGALREALAEADRAVELLEGEAALGELGIALRNRASILASLGRHDDALQTAERARTHLLAQGLGDQAAAALSTMAAVQQQRGRWAAAIDLYERALAETGAGTRERASILGRIGALRLQMGDPASALDLLSRACDAYRALGDRAGAATRTNTLGTALRQLGRAEDALEAHRAALVDLVALERASWMAATHLEIALDLRALGRHPEALEAFAAARAGYRAVDDRVGEARAGDFLGRLLRERGDPAGALLLHDQAAAVHAEAGKPLEVAWALREAAEDLLALDRPLEAAARLDRSLDMDRDALRGLADEEAEGGLGWHGLGSDLGLRIVRRALALPTPPPPAALAIQALRYVEEGRARLLAAGLGRPRDLLGEELPAALLEDEAAARAVLAHERATAARDAASRQRLDAAARDLDTALRAIERSTRRAAWVCAPAPDIAGIQAALLEDEALVCFEPVDDVVAAIVLRRASASITFLPDAQAIRDDAWSFVELAGTADGPEARLAARLHERLLRPLAAQLAGAARLVFAPDRTLERVPFGALITGGVDGVPTRLLEQVEVCVVPSGTVLALLRREARGRPPGRGLVAVAVPGGVPALGLAPLPGSVAEIDTLVALQDHASAVRLVDREATREHLRAALDAVDGRLDVLHLACHATMDPDRLHLSGLRLAEGALVTPTDLATWRIPADLVVASACESAHGRDLVGEGTQGLPRAFLLAGAARVVVSAWRVPDDTTGALLHRFHALRRAGGRGTAAALREAQLERLRAGGRLAHPYHWAAWTLHGLPE